MACTAVQLGYNNAPQITQWWLDDFVDFTSEQQPQVQADLQALHQWHRSQQLGLYLQWLQRAQTLAQRDIDGDEVCRIFYESLDSLTPLLGELEPKALRFLATLQPNQLSVLQKTFDNKNKKWRKEWLNGTDKERLDDRTDKGIDQAENFYGRLQPDQKRLVRQLASASGYDPKVSWQIRINRQADAMASLRKVLESNKTTEELQPLWRAAVERIRQNPDPVLRAYSQDLNTANCQSVATLHNSTTPEQRSKALKKLQAYARDVRQLMARTEGS